jgi:hypothetical protein
MSYVTKTELEEMFKYEIIRNISCLGEEQFTLKGMCRNALVLRSVYSSQEGN